MKNDYLWDGSGEPDHDIQSLEKALDRFQHKKDRPDFLEKMPLEQTKLRELPRRAQWWPRFAAAAVIVLAFGAGAVLVRVKLLSVGGPGWDVAQVEGMPRVGAQKLRTAGAKAKLEVGQVLQTDSESRASVTVAEIGQVDVEPNTRVRLVQTGRDRKRIALEHGTIHAAIWAPPGEFVVDTPSAVAVDLGCAYTLQVDENGSGILRTMLGWVGFQREGRESFIPAGAACVTRAHAGPGTPYFEDATEAFRTALYQLDLEPGTADEKAAAFRIVLKEARERDALTLWHLLSRVNGEERAQVFERLASLVPPPSGVTREDVLRLDHRALDTWWDGFGFGDIGIWRRWEQSWPQEKMKAKVTR